ncbi:hypothetical protein KCP76_00235 [Salmonella enterica subsp. enterica serovar Weltevreden]|nr:hypothetical protein KCP76_00235 [Salmonella enterica subsp. enterica serovar Weltevreden]
MPEAIRSAMQLQAILDTEKTCALPADITTQFQGSTLAGGSGQHRLAYCRRRGGTMPAYRARRAV